MRLNTAKKATLLLFSFAVLLAGGAAALRGQSADGFDPNANGSDLGSAAKFNTRGTSANKPQLDITFQISAPTPTPSPEPTALATPTPGVSFTPSKDNTLYEDPTGQLSNGQGPHLYAGLTDDMGLRRGLIAFDLSSIPTNATITRASLSMYLSRTGPVYPDDISLSKASRNWGEGASNAGDPGGQGTQAQTGDATWLHTFYNTSFWTTPGGDFSSTVSATTTVEIWGQYYIWSSAGLLADVQSWVSNPANNFGWVILGNEIDLASAARFESSESPANPPVLFVTYQVSTATPTPSPTPSSTATPTPTPGTPSPTPTSSPTPGTPTPTPTSTPSPTPSPTLTPRPTPTPRPATLGNISTRLQVGTSDRVMIAGFIVQGSSTKRVLIRAAGPSLANFGVPNALPNPQLELHDSTGTIGRNDDWQTTQIGGVITSDQVAEIQTGGLAPSDPAESAIIATLPLGSYTAIVQGVSGGTGVGIVEVYDLGATSGSLLANISTRGFVQTGDNVMIGGFIVVTQPTRVIIRSIGPSLTQFGVPDALANPQLELHDTNSTIAQNNDWQTTQIGGIITSDQVAEIQNSQLAPTNPAESAILASLPPGSYTAIVRGVNNTTGNALVEVYALP